MPFYRVELAAVIPGGLPFPAPGPGHQSSPLAVPQVTEFLRLSGHQRVATHAMPPMYVTQSPVPISASYGIADECTFDGQIEAATPGEAVIFALCDLDANLMSPDKAQVEVEKLA